MRDENTYHQQPCRRRAPRRGSGVGAVVLVTVVALGGCCANIVKDSAEAAGAAAKKAGLHSCAHVKRWEYLVPD